MTTSKAQLRIIRSLPKNDDGSSFNASRELASLGELETVHTRTLKEICDDLLEHAGNDSHRTTLLDWAAQLRRDQQLTWHEALEAAAIAYFG